MRWRCWARDAEKPGRREETAQRKTMALPSVLSPYSFPSRALPKPTPANLRRFAETPVVRRAINLIKDRVASYGLAGAPEARPRSGDGRLCREARQSSAPVAWSRPTLPTRFRTLLEQVIEDALVGGFGAIEMELTGDPAKPFELWPVDGATIRIDPRWDGRPGFRPLRAGDGAGGNRRESFRCSTTSSIYVRMNPRSFTPFGLGPLEVAFETVNAFLSAHRFAGKLASNAVVQYALWLNETTPAQHERLIRWWQDEIEGTGRVPML